MNLWKKLKKVVTKTIPRVVTKDIPKAVTKDIPEFVTEDVPRFVEEDVVNFVKEDVVDYVTDIPENVGAVINQGELKKEVKALSVREEKARTSLAELREKFFLVSDKFIKTQAVYRARLEDFEEIPAQERSKDLKLQVSDFEYDRATGGLDKIGKTINSFTRSAAAFLTFDLTELLVAPPELLKEKEHIQSELSKIKTEYQKGRSVIIEMAAATKDMKHDIAVLDAELKRHGLLGQDNDVDMMRLRNAEDQALLDTAKSMLHDGLSDDVIASATHLPIERIQQLKTAET